MPVHIVIDSTCDLPTEDIAHSGISVVPLDLNVGDQSFLDGIAGRAANARPVD